MTWIQTYTGRRFFPLNPHPNDIDIEDIAHALSMKCRYNGHTNDYYSVAQHSVLVSLECQRLCPNRFALWWWGLMHDAAEAYIPDIPAPIKETNIGDLKKVEHGIMKAIAERFRLVPKHEPKLVKIIDLAIRADEAAQLMKQPTKDWYLPEKPLGITIEPLSPERAKILFFERYNWLMMQEGN